MMIGAYIITRMASFLTRKGERAEDYITKSLAVITMLIAVICIYALFER